MLNKLRRDTPWPFAFIWTGLVTWFSCVLTWSQLQAVQTWLYPSVPGTVVRCDLELREKPKKDVPRYYLDCEYRYTVDGREYAGTKVRKARHTVRASESLSVGEIVPVYYNPTDPADAVLLPGPAPGDAFTLMFLTPFVLISVGMCWSLWARWTGHRDFDPSTRRCVVATPVGWYAFLNNSGVLPNGLVVFWFGSGCASWLVFMASSSRFEFEYGWWLPAIVWTVLLTVALAYGIVTHRSRILSLDDVAMTLSVPTNSEGDKPAITIDYASVTDITVVIEARHNAKPSWLAAVCRVHWRDANGTIEAFPIAEYLNRVDAEALADWMRTRLNICTPVSP